MWNLVPITVPVGTYGIVKSSIHDIINSSCHMPWHTKPSHCTLSFCRGCFCCVVKNLPHPSQLAYIGKYAQLCWWHQWARTTDVFISHTILHCYYLPKFSILASMFGWRFVCPSVCLSAWTLWTRYRSHRLTNHHQTWHKYGPLVRTEAYCLSRSKVK